MNETMRDLDALDIKVSEALTPWEASEILERELAIHRGRISSGAVKAFLIGSANRRARRAAALEGCARALERFLASPLGLALDTDTASPAMLEWLRS